MRWRRIEWYLLRHVAFGVATTLLVTAAIAFFLLMLGEVRFDADEATIPAALWRALLLLPQQLNELAVAAVVIGALVGIGRLAGGRELTAMQTLGVSRRRIMTVTIATACALTLVIMAALEWAIPRTLDAAFVAEQRHDDAPFVANDVWLATPQGFVSIGGVTSTQLTEIRWYQMNDGQLTGVIIAPYAVADVDGWRLLDSRYQPIMPVDGASPSTDIPQTLAANVVDAVAPQRADTTLMTLWARGNALAAAGMRNDAMRLTFWQHAVAPVVVGLLLLVAAPSVFARERNRAVGDSVIVGLIAALSFHLLMQLIGYVFLFVGWPVTAAVVLPLLLLCGTHIVRKRLWP